MAKYTAEITEKNIFDGELVLQLRYIGDDGTIAYDRPVIKELREWLRDNFKDEYLN